MNQPYKKTEYKKPFVDERVSKEIIRTYAWNIIRELNKWSQLSSPLFALKETCLDIALPKRKENEESNRSQAESMD